MQQNIRITAHDHQRLTQLIVDLGRLPAASTSGADTLAELLDTGRIVPPQDIPVNVVTMNSQVLYEDIETGELREACVVYPEDANPASGRISVLSPVGASLLGLASKPYCRCRTAAALASAFAEWCGNRRRMGNMRSRCMGRTRALSVRQTGPAPTGPIYVNHRGALCLSRPWRTIRASILPAKT